MDGLFGSDISVATKVLDVATRGPLLGPAGGLPMEANVIDG